MKKTIRHGMFETNSSSVHSLIISKEGMSPSGLRIEKTTDMIRVPLKWWGKGECVYDSQLDKLSYICTRAWCGGGEDYDLIGHNDEYGYALGSIEEAICEYTGASGIELYIPDGVVPGFDHQTYPEYSDDMNGFCDIYNNSSIQNFVFNRYISFETYCD